VASRTAQAATLKAEKAGEGTVDLAGAKGKGAGTASSGGSNDGGGEL